MDPVPRSQYASLSSRHEIDHLHLRMCRFLYGTYVKYVLELKKMTVEEMKKIFFHSDGKTLILSQKSDPHPH